jgi:hypothetical protein
MQLLIKVFFLATEKFDLLFYSLFDSIGLLVLKFFLLILMLMYLGFGCFILHNFFNYGAVFVFSKFSLVFLQLVQSFDCWVLKIFIVVPCILIWMFMFTNWCTYLLVLDNTKIYLKFTLKCSYMFRSLRPLSGSSKFYSTILFTDLKFMLPHHCIVFNDVFHLIF